MNLDLDLRLGEGTGGALSMHLVEAAVRILTEVATFEQAAVSRADDESYEFGMRWQDIIFYIVYRAAVMANKPFSNTRYSQ